MSPELNLDPGTGRWNVLAGSATRGPLAGPMQAPAAGGRTRTPGVCAGASGSYRVWYDRAYKDLREMAFSPTLGAYIDQPAGII